MSDFNLDAIVKKITTSHHPKFAEYSPGDRVRVTLVDDPRTYADYNISIILPRAVILSTLPTFEGTSNRIRDIECLYLSCYGKNPKLPELPLDHSVEFYHPSIWTGVEDMHTQIMIHLSVRDLNNLVLVNSVFAKIGRSEVFLRCKIEKDYGKKVADLKPKEESFALQYQKLSRLENYSDYFDLDMMIREVIDDVCCVGRLDTLAWLVSYPEYYATLLSKFVGYSSRVMGSRHIVKFFEFLSQEKNLVLGPKYLKQIIPETIKSDNLELVKWLISQEYIHIDDGDLNVTRVDMCFKYSRYKLIPLLLGSNPYTRDMTIQKVKLMGNVFAYSRGMSLELLSLLGEMGNLIEEKQAFKLAISNNKPLEIIQKLYSLGARPINKILVLALEGGCGPDILDYLVEIGCPLNVNRKLLLEKYYQGKLTQEQVVWCKSKGMLDSLKQGTSTKTKKQSQTKK